MVIDLNNKKAIQLNGPFIEITIKTFLLLYHHRSIIFSFS